MRTVMLDRDSLDQGDLDFSGFDVIVPGWQSFEQTLPQDTSERIALAEVVVTNKVVLDRELIAGARGLKLICVAATGTNNVDLDAASEHGVIVSNARAYATASVAEHVFGLMISLMRNLGDYTSASCDGRWSASDQFCVLGKPITELSGKTLGIVGYGELGKAVARIAKAFGMQVLIANRPGDKTVKSGRVELQSLLPQVDVLSLHCPLADATRDLINADRLRLMKQSAVLINTARGGIVDEQALLHALREGWIGGAALDVLSAEPPSVAHPLLTAGLDNLIITPHVAWASQQARQRLINEVLENIIAYARGEERNRVN